LIRKLINIAITYAYQTDSGLETEIAIKTTSSLLYTQPGIKKTGALAGCGGKA